MEGRGGDMSEVDNGAMRQRRAGLDEERFADVFTQLRLVQAGVSSGDTPSIGGGGGPSFVEQVAYQGVSKPRAWDVRAFGETGTDGQARTVWRIYAPLWSNGKDVLLPAGMGREWNDLPDALASGTLYAALTWTGTRSKDENGEERVSWTPGTPLLTTNPAALPADAEPAEGASGSRTVVVEIGTFSPDAQGSGKTFEQCHVGVIVEGIRDDVVGSGIPDGAEAWGKVEIEEEKDGSTSSGGKTIAHNLYQHKQEWDAAQAMFVDKPDSRVLVGSIPAAGDGGEGADVPPAAWCVRKNTMTETTSSGETTEERWQIYAPTWTVGRETLLPEGMGRDWNDLPDGLTSGTLYAALTWTGTATVDDEGNETVSWAPGTPVITNDTSSIPPDDDPSGAGASSATPGHRSVIVEIGEFSDGDDAFDQRHLGSIVENLAEGGGGGSATVDEAPPASWEVRKIDGVWKIWSPLLAWHNGQISAPKDFAQNEWGDLPFTSGTIYAVITWGEAIDLDPRSAGATHIRAFWLNAGFTITNDLSSVPPDKAATRYEDGCRSLTVPIGRFVGSGEDLSFEQYHVGVIVESVPPTEPYHVPTVLPVGFAITDEGQLEITTRNVNIPIAEKDNTEKILLDLPSGGGGGNGDTLGPIEWDATRNAYVQYIGKWTWSGSAWSFARKQQSGGSDYPPAAIYPVTAADLLIRGRGGSSGTVLTDDIKTLRFNLPFAAATAKNWLSKQETTVSNGVTYEPPEDAGGNGELKTGTFTLTYWSDTTPSTPRNSTLLYTVVETANDENTYEE